MKSWDAAADKIRRRNPEEVIRSIAVETPFEFLPYSDHSDIPDFLDAEWSSIGNGSEVVLTLPGRDINLARDTLIAVTKYCHVLDCARRARARGALTWTLVDAYHAALLGARVLAAFYGVLTYTVKRRTVLIDFRPEFGSTDDKKAFLRANKNVDSPISLLRPSKEKLEQREAWSLLYRLCTIDTTKHGELGKETAEDIKLVTRMQLSSVRNRILYDSVYWTWPNDFVDVERSEAELSSAYSSDDEEVGQLIDGLSRIGVAVEFYTEMLFDHLGIDSAVNPRVHPCFPADLTLHVEEEAGD